MSIPTLVATVGAMAVLDAIWLTLVARGFYRSNLVHLIADATNWPPAVAFYLVYTLGTWFFATQPASTRPRP